MISMQVRLMHLFECAWSSLRLHNMAQAEGQALLQEHAVSLIKCSTACGLCGSLCVEQALLQMYTASATTHRLHGGLC